MKVDVDSSRAFIAATCKDEKTTLEHKSCTLIGTIADVCVDILEELRNAKDRETLPPPCPECQGIHTHMPRCRHFEPRYQGARDIPQLVEVKLEPLNPFNACESCGRINGHHADDCPTHGRRPIPPWVWRANELVPPGTVLPMTPDPRKGERRAKHMGMLRDKRGPDRRKS